MTRSDKKSRNKNVNTGNIKQANASTNDANHHVQIDKTFITNPARQVERENDKRNNVTVMVKTGSSFEGNVDPAMRESLTAEVLQAQSLSQMIYEQNTDKVYTDAEYYFASEHGNNCGYIRINHAFDVLKSQVFVADFLTRVEDSDVPAPLPSLVKNVDSKLPSDTNLFSFAVSDVDYVNRKHVFVLPYYGSPSIAPSGINSYDWDKVSSNLVPHFIREWGIEDDVIYRVSGTPDRMLRRPTIEIPRSVRSILTLFQGSYGSFTTSEDPVLSQRAIDGEKVIRELYTLRVKDEYTGESGCLVLDDPQKLSILRIVTDATIRKMRPYEEFITEMKSRFTSCKIMEPREEYRKAMRYIPQMVVGKHSNVINNYPNHFATFMRSLISDIATPIEYHTQESSETNLVVHGSEMMNRDVNIWKALITSRDDVKRFFVAMILQGTCPRFRVNLTIPEGTKPSVLLMYALIAAMYFLPMDFVTEDSVDMIDRALRNGVSGLDLTVGLTDLHRVYGLGADGVEGLLVRILNQVDLTVGVYRPEGSRGRGQEFQYRYPMFTSQDGRSAGVEKTGAATDFITRSRLQNNSKAMLRSIINASGNAVTKLADMITPIIRDVVANVPQHWRNVEFESYDLDMATVVYVLFCVREPRFKLRENLKLFINAIELHLQGLEHSLSMRRDKILHGLDVYAVDYNEGASILESVVKELPPVQKILLERIVPDIKLDRDRLRHMINNLEVADEQQKALADTMKSFIHSYVPMTLGFTPFLYITRDRRRLAEYPTLEDSVFRWFIRERPPQARIFQLDVIRDMTQREILETLQLNDFVVEGMFTYLPYTSDEDARPDFKITYHSDRLMIDFTINRVPLITGGVPSINDRILRQIDINPFDIYVQLPANIYTEGDISKLTNHLTVFDERLILMDAKYQIERAPTEVVR